MSRLLALLARVERGVDERRDAYASLRRMV